MYPEMIELKAEVEALRKQNHDLTEALLAFFTNGGLRFNAIWDYGAFKTRRPALDKVAHDTMVKQAVGTLEAKLGSREAMHKQNAILKGYALAYINDHAVRERLHRELYGEQH